MKSLLFILTIVFVGAYLSFGACGLLGPEDKEKGPVVELEPGSRNYSWSVDTLSSPPGGFVYSIWGSSENDVWAALGTGINTLWHFNGQSWKPWPTRVSPALYSIFGTAQNNVWMGGNDGEMYHFDGFIWARSYKYSPPGYGYVYFADIYGTSPTDIYAIGGAVPQGNSYEVGFILHYDGERWKEVLLTQNTLSVHRILIQDDAKLILSRKQRRDGNDSLFVYRLENTSLVPVLSSTKSESRAIGIWKIDETIYSYTGVTISKFDGTTFEEFLKVPEAGEIIRIDGRHEKDLFIHNWTTTYHFNGEDVVPLLQELPRNVFRSQLYEDRVFFVVRDFIQGFNVVYHGKLNEKKK